MFGWLLLTELTDYSVHVNWTEFWQAVGFIIFAINELGRWYDRRKSRRLAEQTSSQALAMLAADAPHLQALTQQSASKRCLS